MKISDLLSIDDCVSIRLSRGVLSILEACLPSPCLVRLMVRLLQPAIVDTDQHHCGYGRDASRIISHCLGGVSNYSFNAAYHEGGRLAL